MADFPVCPSSEHTMFVLPLFCPGAVITGRFCRKVVSANLFADTLPISINCTAQSLRPYGPAPFTQGSLSVYPPACLNRPPNSYLSNSRCMRIRRVIGIIVYAGGAAPPWVVHFQLLIYINSLFPCFRRILPSFRRKPDCFFPVFMVRWKQNSHILFRKE